MTRKVAAKAYDHPAKVAVIGLAAVIGVLVLSLGFVALGLAGFRHLSPLQIAAPRLPAAPGPQLEADPSVDLAAVRKLGQARLGTYGWTDRAGGLAHIPIERAMQIEAARGWAYPEPAP